MSLWSRALCVWPRKGCCVSRSRRVRVRLAWSKASPAETGTVTASPSPPPSSSEVSVWASVEPFLLRRVVVCIGVCFLSLYISLGLWFVIHCKVCRNATPTRFLTFTVALFFAKGGR